MDQGVLARKSIERRLAPVREMQLIAPSRGWLRAIREALGMTTRQFAHRLGVARSRITAMEQAEVQGTIAIKTLREAAEAMDCMLVYALVPKRPLDEILRARAVQRADEELKRLDHTMRLESQGLTAQDLATARERRIEELMEGSPRRLWDDA